MARAAVNVDVDSLYLYYRLHDLDEEKASNAVWERGVVRFAELFDDLGVKATFFVVAADLERWPEARRICAELAAAGHEIGNHSYSHPYDLIRKDYEGIAAEIGRAHELLSEVVGRPVKGFRAPGYNMSRGVYEGLADAGYVYSSSQFPCPPYYLAKLGVMATMRLRGKQSAAIVGDPTMMWSSLRPHRRHGVLELPISVVPLIRFPFIGTSLTMMGPAGYRVVKPLVSRLGFVNLEFHGLDLCDLAEDGIDRTLLKQPELKKPVAAKTAHFRRVVRDLRDGWGIATLAEHARLRGGP